MTHLQRIAFAVLCFIIGLSPTVISFVLFVCTGYADSKQRSRWVSTRQISSPRWPTEENRIRGSLFYCRAFTYGYLLRSIHLHRLRRQQTAKSMGLYETRVVEGSPEKISSHRWPPKSYAGNFAFKRILLLLWRKLNNII